MFKGRFPMGRLGEPNDVAKLISFLVSVSNKLVLINIEDEKGNKIRAEK
jgi:NAD(P)-dependent dehydrogenase (short-subunit alcohol dehydrogenase family)